MKRTDFLAGVPEDVSAAFEPILPVVPWKGVGRKPKSNRQCLHALLLSSSPKFWRPASKKSVHAFRR